MQLQTRTRELEDDLRTMQKKHRETDVRLRDLEALVKENQARQTVTNKHQSSTAQFYANDKGVSKAEDARNRLLNLIKLNQEMSNTTSNLASLCTGTCDEKEDLRVKLFEACSSLRKWESFASETLASTINCIGQTPGQDNYVKHGSIIVTLRGCLSGHDMAEKSIQMLYETHGNCLSVGGQAGETYLNLCKRCEEGRKTIEDALREVRKLAGPLNLSVILQ